MKNITRIVKTMFKVLNEHTFTRLVNIELYKWMLNGIDETL